MMHWRYWSRSCLATHWYDVGQAQHSIESVLRWSAAVGPLRSPCWNRRVRSLTAARGMQEAGSTGLVVCRKNRRQCSSWAFPLRSASRVRVRRRSSKPRWSGGKRASPADALYFAGRGWRSVHKSTGVQRLGGHEDIYVSARASFIDRSMPAQQHRVQTG